MKNKILAMALLLVFLFAGCSTGGGQSGENESRAEEAVSSEEAGQEPGDALEPWRQAYYEVLANSLNGPEGKTRTMRLDKATVYFGGSQEVPVLSALYIGKNSFSDEKYQIVWKMDEGAAVQTYAGRGMVATVNIRNGNAILQESISVGEYGAFDTYIEIEGNAEKPLYTEERDMGKWEIITLEDGLRWQMPLGIKDKQLQQRYNMAERGQALNFSFNGENYPVKAAKQKLADYFLLEYQPEIPEEAPEWVKQYLFDMKISASFSYMMENSNVKEMMGGSFIDSVTLTEPKILGDIPAFLYIDFDYGIRKVAFSNGVQQFVSYETGDTFFIDNKGYSFLERQTYHAGEFYILKEDGPELLFCMGFPMEEEDTYASFEDVEEEEKEFPTLAEAEKWLKNKRSVALLSRGYGSTLQELEKTLYLLPPCTNWPELEQALIDVLCEHAQAYGQWGAAA